MSRAKHDGIIVSTMRKTMKAAPGMNKSTVVRTTMKAPFGGGRMKVRATAKRGGRGR